MKVLVATAVTQGRRNNDYTWCVEGELVWIGLVCAKDQEDPDGGCGCGGGFGGVTSWRATTTARVADVAMDLDEYERALRSSLEEQGWGSGPFFDMAEGLAKMVADWPVGTVVERRLDEVRVRAWPHELADQERAS